MLTFTSLYTCFTDQQFLVSEYIVPRLGLAIGLPAMARYMRTVYCSILSGAPLRNRRALPRIEPPSYNNNPPSRAPTYTPAFQTQQLTEDAHPPSPDIFRTHHIVHCSSPSTPSFKPPIGEPASTQRDDPISGTMARRALDLCH